MVSNNEFTQDNIDKSPKVSSKLHSDPRSKNKQDFDIN